MRNDAMKVLLYLLVSLLLGMLMLPVLLIFVGMRTTVPSTIASTNQTLALTTTIAAVAHPTRAPGPLP